MFELDAEWRPLKDGRLSWIFQRPTCVHGFEISGGSPGSEALCLSLLVVGEEQLAVGPVPVAMLDFGDTGVRLVLPILEPAQALTITIHNMTRHNRKIRPVGEQVS